MGPTCWSEARMCIQNLIKMVLASEISESATATLFVHIDNLEMKMPLEVGDYTDFYASKEHATNVGTMFRGKENALMPNWSHMPIGYHGRASSVVVSGERVHRPLGQIKAADVDPVLMPSKKLDFELEMVLAALSSSLIYIGICYRSWK